MLRPASIFTNPPSTSKTQERVYYLMVKDKELLRVDDASITIINRFLLPLELRAKGNITYAHFHNWVSKRVLSMSRSNYKALLNNLGLEQGDAFEVAMWCNALSLTDCYWIKYEDTPHLKWKDVNLYENKFSEAIASIAFTGDSPITITGTLATPELTNQGVYTKCWVREDDGIYLYKASNDLKDDRTTKVERLVSVLLTTSGLDAVPYDMVRFSGRLTSKCKNITNQEIMITPAKEVLTYFVDCGTQPLVQLNKLFKQEFNIMLVVDYLIGNTDRHAGNWGFFMDSATGDVSRMHPLFDHNNAFNFKDINAKSRVYPSMTLKKVAYMACEKLDDISFISNMSYVSEKLLSRSIGNDFTDELLEVKKRCNELLNLRR